MDATYNQLKYFRQYYLYIMGLHETLDIMDHASYEKLMIMDREMILAAILFALHHRK